MKRHLRYISIFISMILTSCTDIIDVELQNEPPRLVVEASLDWEKNKLIFGSRQSIKLSTSTSYFDTNSNTNITGASVKIIDNSNGTVYIFRDQNNGTYTNENFIPNLNRTYTLEVNYDEQTYIAKESLKSVTDITRITQSKNNGFINDVIGVSVSFNDPANEDNYYLIKFQEQLELFPTLFDMDDKFTNGNEMTITYEKVTDEKTGEKELEPGDVLDIELLGISKNYYNYIKLLINQNDSGENPFSTIPAPIKGNVINPSNPDNYAYGYFRLTQVDRITYTIK